MDNYYVDHALHNLKESERLFKLYSNKGGQSRVAYRVKKILRNPIKFLHNNLYKAGIIRNGNAHVRPFWGDDLLLPLKDVNVVSLYYCGSLGLTEGRLTRFLLKHVKQGDVFYDVGANYGYYTNLVGWLLSGTGEVHSFEPNPNTMCFIRENNKTKSSPSVQLVEAAISDHVGTISFYDTVDSRKSGMSSAILEIAQSNRLKYREIQVPCLTLDEYIRDHKGPNVMKIDVEGSESAVLSGATHLLERYSPIITMEVWDAPHVIPRTAKALAILRDAGYTSYEILSDGNIRQKEIQLGSLGTDNIFVFKKEL